MDAKPGEYSYRTSRMGGSACWVSGGAGGAPQGSVASKVVVVIDRLLGWSMSLVVRSPGPARFRDCSGTGIGSAATAPAPEAELTRPPRLPAAVEIQAHPTKARGLRRDATPPVTVVCA